MMHLSTHPSIPKAGMSNFSGIQCFLGPFAISAVLFCHPFWGRDALEKARILSFIECARL